MKRPALFILIFTIIGILFGINFISDITFYIFLFIVIFLCIVIIFKYKNLCYCLILIPALFAFYNGVNCGLYTNSQIDLIADTGCPIKITAIVNDNLKTYDDKTIMYSVSAKTFEFNNTVYNEDINLYLYTDKQLSIGDKVDMKAYIKHGSIKRNDSDFNEIRYLKVKNIEYKAYPYYVNVIGHNISIKTHLKNISYNIKEIIYDIYPYEEAGIITAMILGDKTNIDEKIYDLYKLSGIVHIIAISGLHISLLAGIILYLTKSMGRYISAVIVMLFLLFYCIFTGGSVSVIRAAIMMYFYILSGILGRKYDLLSSTSCACSLLLCYNPYYIYDLGFQYSFISVFTIGFTSQIIYKYNIKNKLAVLFIISLAVSFSLKPITAHNFYYVNFIDVFVNIIAVALMQFILVFSLVSIITAFLYIKIGIFIGGTSYTLLKIIENTARLSLNLPFSHIKTGCIAIFTVIILYIIFISLYKLFMGKPYYISIIIICTIAIFFYIFNKYDGFEAEFIYVGQGDCTIIKDDDKCYLMDAGSSQYSPKGYVILNQLQYENIKKINGIYISHMDYDHMGAILEIAGDIPIENIYISMYCDHNNNYKMLLNIAKENNININFVDESYNCRLTENIDINLIYIDKGSVNNNNGSAVYKIICDDKSILFTGDIDNKTSDKFSGNIGTDSDIIKVPHHGSKNSVSKEFLYAVSPDLAINFAGYNNTYKHPSNETLKVYNEMNIPFLSTNYNGMVKIRINNSKIYYKLLNTEFHSIESIYYK
ncbi:MAG: DNA internalization-related competence protein ComEC/Rec2 [Clostridia bacterium]|nr:DNA internalization-related competence protein ComEC/Rec2 [Clostridia bacterium]